MSQTNSKTYVQFSPLTLLRTTLPAGTSQRKAVVPAPKKPCVPHLKYCRCSWETDPFPNTAGAAHSRGATATWRTSDSQYLRVHCSSINLTGIIPSNSIPHKQTQTTLLLSDLTITLPHKVILESFWQWQPQFLQLTYTQLILNHLSTTVPTVMEKKGK